MSIYEMLAELLVGRLDLQFSVEDDKLVFYESAEDISWRAALFFEGEVDRVTVRLCAAFLNGEDEISCPNTVEFHALFHRQQLEVEFGTLMMAFEEGRAVIGLRRLFYLTDCPDEEGFSEIAEEQLVNEVETFSQEAAFLLNSTCLLLSGGLDTEGAVDLLCSQWGGRA